LIKINGRFFSTAKENFMKKIKLLVIGLVILAVLSMGFGGCDLDDPSGTLRLVNKNLTLSVTKIEVLNTNGSVHTTKSYSSAFTTNESADIELPEGTYKLRVTSVSDNNPQGLAWDKKSNFTITAGQTTVVEFYILASDW
jgi:hypothetical protein